MTLADFDRRLRDHPVISILGAVERDTLAESEVFVRLRHPPCTWGITVAEIETQPWEHIEAHLTVGPQDSGLVHLTRIVGYYSRVSNWNRSKVAELKDRGRGEYAVERMDGITREDLPGEILEGLARAGGPMLCSRAGSTAKGL